jgi:hypothetical protein
MSDEWKSHIKMRGSIWGVLAGLVAGIAFYAWGASHQDPVVQRFLDCLHRELNQYTSRPPDPVHKAAEAKCRQELQSNPQMKP